MSVLDNVCANCGFLAVRQYATRQLVDAERDLRNNGRIPWVKLDGRTSTEAYDEYPVCFMGKVDLQQKIGRPCDDSHRITTILQVTCEDHTPWKQGFTPKEHLEMMQQAARLEWQTRREEADKTERAARDKQARDFQAQQADLNRQYNTRNLWALGAIVIATVVGPIIGAIIASQSVTTPSASPSLPQTDRQTTKADSSPPPSSG